MPPSSEISAASHVNNEEKELSMEASKVMEQISMQAMKMKAVSNGFRRLVLGLLYTANGPMYQSDIADHVEIKPNLLAYHLEILVSANMVEKKYSERQGQKFSSYSIKEEGSKFLEQIGAKSRLDAINNDDVSSLSKRIKKRRSDLSRSTKNSSRRATNRPPNKRCIMCGRKRISPETRSPGVWEYRSSSVCTNCFMLTHNYIDAISTGKKTLKLKSIKESRGVFPLIILDRSLNKNEGIFDNPEDLKKKLNSYRAEHPKSDIKIIDMKYHDYTADILDVPNWEAEANR